MDDERNPARDQGGGEHPRGPAERAGARVVRGRRGTERSEGGQADRHRREARQNAAVGTRAEGEERAAAVRELGVPEPALTADLIAGMLHTALTAVENGTPLDAVTQRTLALVRRCLTSAAGTARSPEEGT